MKNAVLESTRHTPALVIAGALGGLLTVDMGQLLAAYHGPRFAIAAADIDPASIQIRDVAPDGRDGAWLLLQDGDVRWWVRFRCGLALAELGPAGREALESARRDVDRYAGEMATMIGGLSPDSVVELAEG